MRSCTFLTVALQWQKSRKRQASSALHWHLCNTEAHNLFPLLVATTAYAPRYQLLCHHLVFCGTHFLCCTVAHFLSSALLSNDEDSCYWLPYPVPYTQCCIHVYMIYSNIQMYVWHATGTLPPIPEILSSGKCNRFSFWSAATHVRQRHFYCHHLQTHLLSQLATRLRALLVAAAAHAHAWLGIRDFCQWW